MKKKIEETTKLLLQGTLTKDEADKILLDLHNVSNRREQLIAFANYAEIEWNCPEIPIDFIEEYLESN